MSMSKQDESRREFLVRAAVGAVAGAGLVPEAQTQNREQQREANASAQPHATGNGLGAFLNRDDAALRSVWIYPSNRVGFEPAEE